MNISEIEYRNEVAALAGDIVADLVDEATDNEPDYDTLYERVTETVDQHMWIIYHAYALDILQFSDNADAWEQVYDGESLGMIISTQGLNQMHTVLAFCAMQADVLDVAQGSLVDALNEQFND